MQESRTGRRINDVLSGATDLFELGVGELVRAQPAQRPVQLQQLQGVAVEPPTHQETGQSRRQEEQRADVPLV